MLDPVIALERLVPLAGASNFRDLGGYVGAEGATVRWRRVFRADALHDLTDPDIEAVLSLGVGDVFDLRTARELEFFGINPLTERGVRHHHTPLMPEITVRPPSRHDEQPSFGLATDEEHAERYLEMLDTGKPALERILAHLAAGPDAAVVFHCTGGRDRTGLTAALLLSALGVSRDVIAQDYELTHHFLHFTPERRERMRALWGVSISNGTPPTRAEVMRLTLAALDAEYGSPDGYLDEAGVTADVRAQLRHQLLEA